MLIIDGNNMAYRAKFTVSLSHHGVDVSIVYGTLNMIGALIRKHRPRYVVVCFDGRTPAFRRRILQQYKQRPRQKGVDWNDVWRQLDELHTTTIPLHGMLSLKRNGAEADDLMAQVAQLAWDRSYIVTADDDLIQCVNSAVSIINPTKGKILTFDSFQEEMGFSTEYHLLYKMMVGDISDNITGIPGIGKVAAPKIIREMLSLMKDPYDYVELLKVLHKMKSPRSHQRTSLRKLGEDAWYDLYDIMDLSADRTWSRATALSTEWIPANKSAIREYYVKNGFASLLENSLQPYLKLLKPPLDPDVRCPAPIIHKEPIDADTCRILSNVTYQR